MPSILNMSVLAAVLFAAVVWVHAVLPRVTRGRAGIAHALLLATGIGCAVVGYLLNRGDAAVAVLSAAIGFGVVHVPAAFILALKLWSGSRKS